MNDSWPDAAPIKKAKRGYVYMTVLFIAFLVFVFASFLLGATTREGTFLKSKWTYFQEDLNFEGKFLQALAPEKRENLTNTFATRQNAYQSYQVSFKDQGLDLDFIIDDWHNNLGTMIAHNGDDEKQADFFLFDPVFQEENPYLQLDAMGETLQADFQRFMEKPSLLNKDFFQIQQGQVLTLRLGPKNNTLLTEDGELLQQDKNRPLYIENQGTLQILGPGTFRGVLVNKGVLLGDGGLLQGLLISNTAAPIKVRGQVLGQGRTQDALYDKSISYTYLSKLPFFFAFQLKNIQSRPHDYF